MAYKNAIARGLIKMMQDAKARMAKDHSHEATERWLGSRNRLITYLRDCGCPDGLSRELASTLEETC